MKGEAPLGDRLKLKIKGSIYHAHIEAAGVIEGFIEMTDKIPLKFC
jgi:hypothetical protein